MSANSSEQFAYVENIGNIEENYEYKSIAKANSSIAWFRSSTYLMYIV